MKLDVILVIVVSAIGLIWIYHEWQTMKTQIGHQGERIAKLESSNRLRMPQKSYEELLDLMAALDAAEQEAQFKVELIRNARGHATNAMTVGTKREK
jgi:hypothetical protein